MLRPIAIALGLTIAVASSAQAHGYYDWINKGGYRNLNGEQCCGKDDCFQLESSQVEDGKDGYRVPSHGVTIPFGEARRSEDDHYWICRTSAKMRCF